MLAQAAQHNSLDLIFCNDPCAVVVTDYLPPFSTSDHVMIEFSTFLPLQQVLETDAQLIKLNPYMIGRLVTTKQ